MHKRSDNIIIFSQWKLFLLSAIILFTLQISLQATDAPTTIRTIELRWEAEFKETDGKSEFYLIALLPKNALPCQRIIKTSFNLTPTDTIKKGSNDYAVWKIPLLKRNKLSIVITVQAELLPYNILTADKNESKAPSQDISKAEKNIDTNDEVFRQIAQSVRANTTDNLTIAKELLRKTITHLKYIGDNKKSKGALEAWRKKSGDCTDFADVYVTLCRSAGIPARHITGYVTDWVNIPGHSWTEIYLSDKGWVPVDPFRCHLKTSEFGKMPPIYLRVSTVRNDTVLKNGMLFRWKVLGKGKARVKMTLVERTHTPQNTTNKKNPAK